MTHSAAWIADAREVDDAWLCAHVGWLDESDAVRFSKFVRRERQRQFLIGRVLLKQELGRMLGVPPRAISLSAQAGKGPELDWPHGGPIALSVSHSGPWVACAASQSTALGLDIEVIDPARDVLALAEQAFGPAEAAWLAARQDATRVPDFYEKWCEHEARIKLGLDHCYLYVLRHHEVAAVLCTRDALQTAPAFVPVTLSGETDWPGA
jgi:4'-phosphopantetheinyl transferase